MKKLIALSVSAALLFSACSNAALKDAGKELEDTISNVTNADNEYVLMVKGGYRETNPDLTYGNVFEQFFGTPRWKYFKSEDGQDVVEFTGDCMYADAQVKARIQFIVDEENGTFEAAALAFNKVPQTDILLLSLISKAFEEAEPTGQESINEAEFVEQENFTAEEAVQLLDNWLENHPMVYDCEFEYNGERTLYSGGSEVYDFYLILDDDVWYPVTVEKSTGEIWVDIGQEVLLIDEFYSIFCN